MDASENKDHLNSYYDVYVGTCRYPKLLTLVTVGETL